MAYKIEMTMRVVQFGEGLTKPQWSAVGDLHKALGSKFKIFDMPDQSSVFLGCAALHDHVRPLLGSVLKAESVEGRLWSVEDPVDPTWEDGEGWKEKLVGVNFKLKCGATDGKCEPIKDGAAKIWVGFRNIRG